MSSSLFLLLVLAVIVWAIAAFLASRSRKGWRGRIARIARRSGSVAARQVMTANELQFFFVLRAALPDFVVLAQVSFGALLRVARNGGATADGAYWKIYNSFGQKIADFVVLDETGAVVAVIELDDRTHDKSKDAKRDELLASASIRTVRYESKAKPDAMKIRRDLGLRSAASKSARFS